MTTRWEFERAVRVSGLPALSRLILLNLAIDTDRGGLTIPAQFTPSLSKLSKDTNIARSTLAEHLNTLEAAGWVERLRPSTADQVSKKAKTRYRLAIPTSPATGPVPTSTSPAPEPALVRPPDQPAGWSNTPKTWADQRKPRGLGSATSPPAGHSPELPPEPFHRSARGNPFAGLDTTEDERAAVINRITATANVRNLDAYLATLADNGDLAGHLAAVRQERQGAAVAAELAAARTGPDCIHGNPGGQHRRSDTGRLLCPQCQRNHERNTA